MIPSACQNMSSSSDDAKRPLNHIPRSLESQLCSQSRIDCSSPQLTFFGEELSTSSQGAQLRKSLVRFSPCHRRFPLPRLHVCCGGGASTICLALSRFADRRALRRDEQRRHLCWLLVVLSLHRAWLCCGLLVLRLSWKLENSGTTKPVLLQHAS
jgi:hypothetical protein